VDQQATPLKTRPPRLSGHGLDYAILIVLFLIWGSAYAAIKIGGETISPLWLVAMRLVVGAACLGAVAGARAARRSTGEAKGEELIWRSAAPFIVIGVAFTALPFWMYAFAGRLVDSAVMAICNGAAPVFTAIFAHLFIAGDKLTWRRVIGVALGFAGLVVLVLPAAAHGMNASLLGVTLGIAGAALYAGGNIVTMLAPRVSPLTSSLVINLAGMVAILPVALLAEPFPVHASLASIIAGLLLGVFSTAVGMILYVWLIQRSGPVFVSLITYLAPLWATALGVGLLGEHLDWSMLGALALILAGVAVANAKRSKAR
jgi:drug/metabolite transporter (DMT)-like permease